MTTGNTTLLGLALPVEGELDGTWGDVVNDSITSLVDSAVAGTTTLSVDADVTLTTTVLAANQARQAVLLWTANNGATTRNITAPAQSKPYIVINAGTGSVVLRGAGPTTGITIVAGEKCVAAWNGSDFVKVSTSTAGSGDVVGPASSTDNAFARFDSTTGKLLQNSTGATLSDTGAASFTGAVNVAGTSSSGGGVVLAEDTDNGTNTVTLSAPSNIATSFELKLPNADGTAGQAIVTDGTGNLTFASSVSLSADNTWTGTQSFTGTSSKLAEVLTNAAEVATVSATAATGTINYDITTQSVLYYTSNASANWTTNFRASSGTSLNTALSTGQSVTAAFLVTQGSTAYYNSAVQVDGTTSGVTTRWLGGAPTAGNASGIDSYRYLIIKTGSATFTVLASVTQFKA